MTVLFYKTGAEIERWQLSPILYPARWYDIPKYKKLKVYKYYEARTNGHLPIVANDLIGTVSVNGHGERCYLVSPCHFGPGPLAIERRLFLQGI